MFELLADTGDAWPAALDAALKEQDSSIAEQFASFAQWNLFTADRADPERAYKRGDTLPKLKETDIQPGFRDVAVRVFPLAARYYTLQTVAAESVIAKAELSDDKGVADLQLMIAVEHSGDITSVEHAEPMKSRELEVELGAGDTAHIVLFNTAHSGGSIRPDLCIATQSTQKLCEPKADTASKSDSGCAVLARRSQPSALWLLSLSAAALASRRARSRRRAPRQLAASNVARA
jgi:hypothetical protein